MYWLCTVTPPPGVNPIAVDKYIYLSNYLTIVTQPYVPSVVYFPLKIYRLQSTPFPPFNDPLNTHQIAQIMKLSITVAATILSDVRFIEQSGYCERPYGWINCVTVWMVNANVSQEKNASSLMVNYTLKGVYFKINVIFVLKEVPGTSETLAPIHHMHTRPQF